MTPAAKVLFEPQRAQRHRELPQRTTMTKVADRLNEISGMVVDSALKVHRALGRGLLESAYHACLLYELRKRGLEVGSQIEMPIRYDNIVIDTAFRIDLLVEHKVV